MSPAERERGGRGSVFSESKEVAGSVALLANLVPRLGGNGAICSATPDGNHLSPLRPNGVFEERLGLECHVQENLTVNPIPTLREDPIQIQLFFLVVKFRYLNKEAHKR